MKQLFVKAWVLPLAVVSLAGVAPLAAKDWRFVTMAGEKPGRSVELIDAASIDRTDPQMPTFNLALLLETPVSDGTSQGLTTQVIDCAAQTIRILDVTMLDRTGTVISQHTLDNDPATPIVAGSNSDVAGLGACQNQWSDDSPSFGDMPLDAIATAFFEQ